MALAEAEKIVKELERRFGSCDPRALKTETAGLGAKADVTHDRVMAVARMAYQAQMAKLTRQYELKRSLSKGLGLGM